VILVVDDLPQNVRLLEAILSPRGYDVVASRTSGGVDPPMSAIAARRTPSRASSQATKTRPDRSTVTCGCEGFGPPSVGKRTGVEKPRRSSMSRRG